MKRKWILGLAVAALVGCGGGDGKPKRVGLLPKAQFPKGKANFIPFDNGTGLGCGGLAQSLRAAKLVSTDDRNGQDNHDEPPIGGEDGSFIVHMTAHYLPGTSETLLRSCVSNHATGTVNYSLSWAIYTASGGVLLASDQANPVPIGANNSVVATLSDSSTVTYSQFVDADGTAWDVALSAGKTFETFSLLTGKTGYRIKSLPSNVRLTQIAVGSQTIPLQMTGEENTCATFQICHTGTGHLPSCAIPPVPFKCQQVSVKQPPDHH